MSNCYLVYLLSCISLIVLISFESAILPTVLFGDEDHVLMLHFALPFTFSICFVFVLIFTPWGSGDVQLFMSFLYFSTALLTHFFNSFLVMDFTFSQSVSMSYCVSFSCMFFDQPRFRSWRWSIIFMVQWLFSLLRTL